MLDNAATYIFAGLSAMVAVGLATWQIMNHLQNYTQPIFQRFIVRIIFMVPVYAVSSFCSLIFPHGAIYFDTVRICYEAFVIYNFLSLCLSYVGGPGAVEVQMNGYLLMPSWWNCTCCLPPQMVDGLFVRRCKQGAIQFVLLMPILGILSTVLYATGYYHPGDWGASSSYLWITIIYNITYSVALFALLMFYLGTHDMLAPFNPLLKFILVKSVVFFTFWQGILLAILVGTGAIASAEDAGNVQNLLICLEMLPASIAMFFAFPHTEYLEGGPASGMPSMGNAIHAISIHDVASDTVHQFAPTYRDYVLYSDSNNPEEVKEAPKTFRAKTFVAIGQKKAQDGLLQNMEMGNSAAWYNQDSGTEGAAPPAAEPMERGTGPEALNGITPTASPKSIGEKLGNGKPGETRIPIVAKSENPDLSYINSDALAARVQPADPPPPVRQPSKDPAQPGAWADVGLDD